MTSNTCYVYITLPGQTVFVTAGRYELTKNRHGEAVGRFVYGRNYRERADAVPLDPIELKLSPHIYETAALQGMFGALRDAGPDYWGRRVIERHLGNTALSELDYLLHSPDDRAGALGFGLNVTPPSPLRKFNRTLDLAQLQITADAIIKEKETIATSDAIQIENLLLLGTSMGGARPKAVVEEDGALWLAKFNRPDDKWNNARVEHTMLRLARSCGVTTAESRIIQVGDREVLLVKRFDREHTPNGYLRARMVSGLTLLRAEDTPRSHNKWSYVFLAEELRRLCVEARQETAELFRRMCFNALISNGDDHPRNHAVIAKEQDWKLSPAYDLTPTSPIAVERRDLAMICGDAGRYANAENLLSQHARFLLTADEAASIINKMEACVRDGWYRLARSEGVCENDCERIAGAFAYPGFRINQQKRG
jgi:serine/threonine-protein kinase HipA